MKKALSYLDKHKFFFLLFILLCCIYSQLVINRALVEITIDVEQKTPFTIFWAEEGQGFSEQRMARVFVKPGKKKYRFYLTNLHNIDKLRVDTHAYVGDASLKSLKMTQIGVENIYLTDKNDFSVLKPINHIANISYQNNRMVVQSDGNDPIFEWDLAISVSNEPVVFVYIVGFLLIGVFLWLVVHNLGLLNNQLQYVPYLLAGVLMLVLVLACVSADKYHPDERVHVDATNYYKNNWTPPVIEDESIRYTYSVYGASRLNYGEVYYLVAGKFVKCLEVFQFKGYLPYRLFNVFLFSLILIYTIRVPQSRLLAIPFLISPQLWYAFSYCTSDAFALFIAYLVGCQLFVSDSMLRRLLKDSFNSKQIFRFLSVGFLFTMLLLLKKNFLPFTVAVFVIFLVDLYQSSSTFERKRTFIRLICLLGVIGCFFGVHKSVDISINGFDKKERMNQLAIEIAEPLFNLSTPLEQRSPLFNLQERGVTVKELLYSYRWFEKSFRSSFGVYGHSNIMAQKGYYDCVRYVSVAFLLFFFGSVLLKSPWVNKIEGLALLSLAIALIGASIHHSYTMEVQAQGRYLFPIFGIFGLIYGRNYGVINSRIFTLFVVSLFLISTHSFIFEAIYRIPKIRM